MTGIIVDDEYLAIKVLEEYAGRIEAIGILKTFKDPRQALAYLQQNSVDLMFLDIQMPFLSGFEVLRELSSPPMVVFTTARHEFAVQAFELEVLDYLVKPISFSRFEKAVARAVEYLAYKKHQHSKSSEGKDYIMIRSDYRIHKIMVQNIQYIEGLGEYVKIYTPEKMFVTLAALKNLVAELPTDRFLRIHKSFIVSKGHVLSYTHQSVRLVNAKELPLGRAYKDQFIAAMR